MLLPGIVSSGLEVGIIAKKETTEYKKNVYRRLGLSFMNQRVALKAMSLNLTKVLLV